VDESANRAPRFYRRQDAALSNRKAAGLWLEASETMSRKTRCFAIDAAKPISSSRSLRPLLEWHRTV
jgi:hypothetical protein